MSVQTSRHRMINFRRLPGPVLILPGGVGAHFPEQRPVIEPSHHCAKVELMLSIEFDTAVAGRVKQAYVTLSLVAP